ncbi:MAG: metal-dependent hydrolase [Candidatus Acidiferrales bacterium]
MDPFTHALSSLVLGRAVRTHLPRHGFAMLLVAGVAPDLDSLSYFLGAAAYLRFHQSLLHSVISSIALACVLTVVFVAIDRRQIRRFHFDEIAQLRFAAALAVCAAGIALHLLLDAATDVGFQPLWPFRNHWTAFDLVPKFEIWIALILVAALAIPELINMVSEEIGEHHSAPRGILAARIGLVVFFAYIGVRTMLHNSAITMLDSREYQGLAPLAVGAFPTASPLTWRGVVSTERALDEVELPFMPGESFDPDRAVAHNKPDESQLIETASGAGVVKTFLYYARFPLASVDSTDAGDQVRFRDLRFEANDKSPENLAVEVLVTPAGQPVEQTVFFNASGPRE